MRLKIKTPKKMTFILDHMKKSGFPLREHQKEGVEWMLNSEKSARKGGILADDPGLGKTIQALALCVGNKVEKTLISVPSAVLMQWKEATERILPKNKIYIHYGGSRLKTQENIKEEDFSICITTHGMLFSRKKSCVTTELHISDFWSRIIIDEGHVIRNRRNKIAQSALMFEARYRWLLTGTPVQNRKSDMVNLLEFLGVNRSAAKHCCKYYVGKYLLRRGKEIIYDGVFIDYEHRRVPILFETYEEQHDYLLIFEALDKAIEGSIKSGLVSATDLSESLKDRKGMSKINKLEWMLRLRQASSDAHRTLSLINRKHQVGRSPLLVPSSPEPYIPSKINRVIQDIQKSEGLSIVFCHFRREMNMVQTQLLAKTGRESYLYNGSLNLKEREIVLSKFSDDEMAKMEDNEKPVLIIQIKAGGVGINLQQFENVFLLSPDWNPTNEIQAISRAHRMGQKKKVSVTRYIITYDTKFRHTRKNKEGNEEIIAIPETTMDQDIMETQKGKYELMEELLDDDSLQFRK